MDLLQEIKDASGRLAGNVLHTPLLYSPYLSNEIGGKVYLKLESEQVTGSFKARGSLNKLAWLREQGFDALPITASTGNHGLGFARALNLLGMKGKIYLPKTAVTSKVEKIRQYDVDLQFYGEDPYRTEVYARQQAEKNGWIYVSPYNDPQVIGGQGTVGVEILKDLSKPDHILVTVGGGGLVSGIGTWIKEHHPEAGIIGCQPENSPEMSVSVDKGEHVEMESKSTLSDGSAGGFEPDSITFDLCREVIDRFILVSEEEIREGILLMADRFSKLVEGSSAVALQGLLKEKEQFAGQTIVVVICGANISLDTFKNILCDR